MDNVLPVTELQAQLEALASQVIDTLPDLHHMARTAATGLLQRLHVVGEPDLIWWHRFSSAASSPLTFTGLRHAGTPIESMTLTELVMRRFLAQDQDNSDVLNTIGGFYREGPGASSYDHDNEVLLLPQDVLHALWTIDFSAHYWQVLSDYWKGNRSDVRAVIRLTCLNAAVSARQADQLTTSQLQWIYDGLGIDKPLALTLKDIDGVNPARRGVSVASVSLLANELINVLCLRMPTGPVILYLAGREVPFQGFDDLPAMHRWLHEQLGDAPRREQLLAHCAVVEPGEGTSRASDFAAWAERPLADLIPRIELHPVDTDVCAWLSQQVRTQMFAQAHLLLHTNSDLRRQLWIGYLRVGLRIVSPFAPMVWPVATVAVIAGIAGVSLNIEEAINGRSAEERRAAVIGAVICGVELLFNAYQLISMVYPLVVPLKPLASPMVVASGSPPLADAQGVLALEGKAFIRMRGVLYNVRYDQRLGCWLVVDPEQPFSFYGNYPVRLNSELEWELVDGACLRGGGACMSRLASAPRIPVDYAGFEVAAGEYDVPATAREAVRELLGAQFRRALAGDFYDPAFHLNPVMESLLYARARLIEDATQFIDELGAVPTRSALYAPDPELPAPVAFRRMFDEAQGVVIGESHQSIASKRFLIENMRDMARQGVNTLYLEHVMTDLHQIELDLFARSGRMPASLQDYLRDLDIGHNTDPTRQFNFTQLVRSAQRNGMRVAALDCAASYRLDGLEHLGDTLRQRLFSAFGSRQIYRGQSLPGSGKWVALVGESHVCTYKGVPGLAQMTDVTGLRIVDAGAGQATNMTLDPGEYYLPSMGKADGVVRADWRLALQTRAQPYEYLDPSLAPPGVFQP